MLINQPFPQVFKGVVLLFLMTLMLTFAGCSPLGLLNSVIPSSHYQQTLDITYGKTELQKLDIYQPVAPCKNCPVLIWVYGGAWNSGNKEDYQFIGEAFASSGMIVVIPDYRKYPQVRFPSFIDDVAQAVSWVEKNIRQYGGNADELNLMGHSAGAHIVMMLAFDSQYLAKAGVPKASIKTAIGLAGPYNFLPMTEASVIKTFATAKPLETSQPITYANSKGPSVFLAVGLDDERVNPENTFSMAKKLQEVGGRVKLMRYPDLGHPGILLSLYKPLRSLSSVYPDVLQFLKDSKSYVDNN